MIFAIGFCKREGPENVQMCIGILLDGNTLFSIRKLED